MRVLAVFVLLVSAVAGRAAPQEALALALVDAKTLDQETGYYTRYLDGTHLTQEDLTFYTRNTILHLNLLSRASRIYQPRPVAGGQLLAIDLRYLAEDDQDSKRLFAVWERLRDREPYYHQKSLEDEYQTNQYGQRAATGKKKTTYYRGQHLRQVDVKALETTTSSYVPIVTMDWFFFITSIQADRGGIGTGFGYYDFVGIKNRDDFFKLVGVNLEDRRSKKSELLAVVPYTSSGVAQNDRMIVRRGAVDGFLWFTLDFFDNNIDDRNPMAYLDPNKGLKHQAERHFATLPNGLPVVIACDDKGNLQESAPDKIGPDKTARGNDGRIHSAKSCISCHANGFLKDIADEVRVTYKFDPQNGFNVLTAATKEEEIRLHDAYLRDFKAKLEADRLTYETKVKECIGTTSKEASDDYREGYERYLLRPMSTEEVARGIGVSAKDFLTKLRLYRKADQLTIHTLAPLSVGRSITRQNYEQLYPLLQQITRGVPVS